MSRIIKLVVVLAFIAGCGTTNDGCTSLKEFRDDVAAVAV